MVWGVPLFHLIFMVSKSEGCCPFVAADAVHALEVVLGIAVLGQRDEGRGVEGGIHQRRNGLDRVKSECVLRHVEVGAEAVESTFVAFFLPSEIRKVKAHVLSALFRVGFMC